MGYKKVIVIGALLWSSTAAATEIRGSIPKKEILRVIKEHTSEVRACYEAGLRNDSKLAGRVVAWWKIGAEGTVQSAKVKESSLKSPPVETCIVDAIKTWKFPAPTGGGVVEINYPFLLKAS